MAVQKPVFSDSSWTPKIRLTIVPSRVWQFVCWSPLGGYRHPYDEHLFDPFREVAEAVA